MTKIAVYQPTGPVIEPEPIIYLKLQQNDDHVLLLAVDENGSRVPCGNLMRFYPDGTFQKNVASEVAGQRFVSRGTKR